MFINSLFNQGNLPLIEQQLRFTAKRHQLIAENIANLDTPFYQQKDLDPKKFETALRERVTQRAESGQARGETSFDDLSDLDAETPRRGMLFHDGTNRSPEQLMSDMAKNALTHNVFVEFMRGQFSSYKEALKEHAQ